MSGSGVLLDSFDRVNDTMHRVLGDLTQEETHAEPHPSIGWLGWRLTRVADGNISRLSGTPHLWMESWAAKFGMPPVVDDFGRGATHTREQVRAFNARPDLILAYYDASYERLTAYIGGLSDAELDRELNEPQYTPLPTVAVRLVSVLENQMHNAGQMAYLKAYHRLGGWFPAEAKDRSVFR